jgi:hypothetical protein
MKNKLKICHIDGLSLHQISDEKARKILEINKEEFIDIFGDYPNKPLLACDNGHVKTNDGICFNCDECAGNLFGIIPHIDIAINKN